MKAQTGKIKKLSKLFYLLGISMLISGMMLSFIKQPASAILNDDMQLNLSHIMCVNGQVEVHFVLLNVPDGTIPGSLTYNYGTIPPSKNTGNVWHYSDYVPSGYYNVTFATVNVNGTIVSLHNPGAYAGEYDCSSTSNPTAASVPTFTPTPTETKILTPTPTETVTATPTLTVTPTTITFSDLGFAYVCSPNGTTWYVSNPNPFDVTFSYSINGGGSQDFTVPASTDNLTFVIAGPEAGTLYASVNFAGVFHEYSLVKVNSCEVSSKPQELIFNYVCNINSINWNVTNPNNYDIPFVYVVDPIQGITLSSSNSGNAIAPAGGSLFTFFVSTPASHVVQISYDLGDGQTRDFTITNGNDFCKVTTVDTPVPSLQVPPENPTSTILIPVTGADLSGMLIADLLAKGQKYLITIGLGLFGLGMVLHGVAKKIQ